MVIQGSFSVRLINAATMKPFAEHTSSTGKVCVTMKPGEGFFVHMEVSGSNVDESAIVYKTLVKSDNRCMSTGQGWHTFKRASPGDTDRHVFRFETAAKPYQSITRAKVTVCIYEQSSLHRQKGAAMMSKRRLLDTVTIHCLVIPSDRLEYGLMDHHDQGVSSTDANLLLPLNLKTLQNNTGLTTLPSPSWITGRTSRASSKPLAARILPEKLHVQQRSKTDSLIGWSNLLAPTTYAV